MTQHPTKNFDASQSNLAAGERNGGGRMHGSANFEDAFRGARNVVAVGRVPNRTDGILSLHVGERYVLLSPQEARALADDLLTKSLP